MRRMLVWFLGVGIPLSALVGGLLGWRAVLRECALRASIRAEEEKVDPELVDGSGYADLQVMLKRVDAGGGVYSHLLSRLGYFYKNLPYRTREDDETIFRIFNKLAEHGQVGAMCEIAHLHLIGQGTPKNAAASVEWYRKAHAGKNPFGTFGLAHAHRDGLGVAADMRRAVELYQEAERNGVGGAACELGEIYERGLLGKVDVAEAIRWHRKSLQARQNHFGHRERSEAALKRLTQSGQGR